MALTRIQPPAIADVREPNFRNIVINGDMSLAQRSTSVSGITAFGYYTVDRMRLFGSYVGTWTQSQDTDVPTGQGFAKSLKMDCTTSSAVSAGSHLIINQRFEGQNLQYLKKGTSSAESLTLSFWVKSNKTGTYICELNDNDNTRQISKSYTISSADTWEKKTITYAGDTTGAFDNDNALSLYCNFWIGAGSNFTSGTLNTSWNSVTEANRAVGQVNLADSTSNEFFITGIQLEAGSVATDFEVVPFGQNLQRCQRYYYKVIAEASGRPMTSLGYCYDTTAGYVMVPFSTIMRISPTALEQNGTASDYSILNNIAGAATCSAVPAFSQGMTWGARITFTVASGLTAGQGIQGRASNTNAYLAWSAEL
jgi:hypothetical protein